jgi:hypothetical protein
MTDREKELRRNAKWNRIVSYIAVVVSFANALVGNSFCFVLLGLAAFNWYIAKLCDKIREQEFPE